MSRQWRNTLLLLLSLSLSKNAHTDTHSRTYLDQRPKAQILEKSPLWQVIVSMETEIFPILILSCASLHGTIVCFFSSSFFLPFTAKKGFSYSVFFSCFTVQISKHS